MQRIKHHYCWVKAHPMPTAGKSDGADPAHYLPAAGPGGASMQFFWSENGALQSSAQGLTCPPLPGGERNAYRGPKSATGPEGDVACGPKATNPPGSDVAWGPKAADAPGSDVAWGPKASDPPGPDVAWGPKASDPPGPDVAWGPKSAPQPGEVTLPLERQGHPTAIATASMGRLTAQSADGAVAQRPYWGPKAAGMQFAGATLMGGWQFEHALVGNGIQMSFSVVLGDRRQALGWLAEPDGCAWSADALAISLICFAAAGDF